MRSYPLVNTKYRVDFIQFKPRASDDPDDMKMRYIKERENNYLLKAWTIDRTRSADLSRRGLHTWD